MAAVVLGSRKQLSLMLSCPTLAELESLLRLERGKESVIFKGVDAEALLGTMVRVTCAAKGD